MYLLLVVLLTETEGHSRLSSHLARVQLTSCANEYPSHVTSFLKTVGMALLSAVMVTDVMYCTRSCVIGAIVW